MNAAGRGEPAASAPSSPTAWLDEMAGAIANRIVVEVFPSRRNDLRFIAVMGKFVRNNIVTVAATFNNRITIERPDPESPARCGRWIAECGFPVSTVRDSYWVGMREMLDMWADQEWASLDRDDSQKNPGGVVGTVTKISFDLTELGLRRGSRAHEETTARLHTSGALQRHELIMDIVHRRPLGRLSDLEATLSYRLSGSHVGLVLDVADSEQAKQALRKTQLAARAGDLLTMMLDPHRWAAWFNCGHNADRSVAAITTALGESGVRATMGSPHGGLSGFRRTHLQAVRTEELRSVLQDEQPVLRHRDLALEAVLLQDPSNAAAFAIGELGELAETSARAETIRKTLFVLLSSGSRTATASELGVHENTVRQRLHFVTEVLGPDYSNRRPELLAALKICRALGVKNVHARAESAT
ncbi:PucR family transcriptional regulator [Streptomyces sp. NPDC102274]|uniref:PucR family transcriptional regulator n=1 Tax=Streptomyces sp. NPDC102274 TaxID=3366151 RepID=UPI00381F7973